MKIILSPAKKMKVDTDGWITPTVPFFIEKSKRIVEELRGLSYDELKKLWAASDDIVRKSIEMLRVHSFDSQLTPAILAYDGIAFTHMAPNVFENGMFDYVEENLIILSALYGALKPSNGVMPYRLEMQAQLGIDDNKNLYEYWGDKIYSYIKPEDGIIVNLASKEYSDAILPYAKSDRVVDIVFVEESKGKLVTKATFAKMARGEMVRFMAKNKVRDINEIKEFNILGFCYRDDLSNDNKIVFERRK